MLSIFRKKPGARSIIGYTADFIIVILGVFFGLQAQNWASNRADAARAEQYVERLELDFMAILADLDICRRISGQSVDAIEQVRLTIEDKTEGRGNAPQEGFAESLIAMTAGVMPPGRSAAYVEMISSGDLRLLEREALRAALVQYDEDAATNRDTWLLLREMLNPLIIMIYRHVTLRKETNAQARIGDYDLEGLATDPEVMTALNALMGTATNAYQLCESQGAAAKAVMAQLRDL